jgi:hypothetical protein
VNWHHKDIFATGVMDCKQLFLRGKKHLSCIVAD